VIICDLAERVDRHFAPFLMRVCLILGLFPHEYIFYIYTCFAEIGNGNLLPELPLVLIFLRTQMIKW